MAVRSKRLFGPEAVAAANEVVYTSPAGETTIIKHLSFANTALVANTVSLRINASGGGATIGAWPVAGQGAEQVPDLFIVLQPGDTLNASATQSSMIVTGFGAQLEGVAD